MESDIDVTKSPKEIFMDGAIEWANVRGNLEITIEHIQTLWAMAGQPAVDSVKFTTQDLKDGLDASLIPMHDDLKLAMLLEWKNELEIRINELLAKKSNRGEE